MTRVDVSEQELEVFLNVADRLGIGVRDLLEKDVPFREMELAGASDSPDDDRAARFSSSRAIDWSPALSDLR